MLAIHLDGAFLTTRACLKLMYAQKPWRQRHLHGLRAFEGSLAPEGGLTSQPSMAWSACAKVVAKEGAASTACAPT